jgi:serine/threonine protein kinase
MTDQVPSKAPSDSSLESLVSEATDEYLERVGRGEEPDIEDYVRRYPQVAEVLRDVLPALRAMHAADTAVGFNGHAATTPPIGGLLGEYRILREIGRGGMGMVYEAEQISLQRRVALKVLPFAAALDPKRLERFKNEALAAARLHHSHIVPVYAVGCERGVYYYAMQMIEGASLADLIEQLRQEAEVPRGEIPPRKGTGRESSHVLDSLFGATVETAPREATAETRPRGEAAYSTVRSKKASGLFRLAAAFGIQAAEALEHAHGQNIVHRDIKPANLLIDTRGNLWVTDFGLARLHGDGELTMTGDVMGTYRYMSPEQALGKNFLVDHRTDLYSLGATLYELSTLRPAFDGDCREDLLTFATSREPILPRRINPSIPRDLETIILKALAKEPQDRYATAAAMAEDLRRFLDSRPIRAKRPTLVERAAKWSRRHKAAVASAMILLLLAVIGLTVSNVMIARERAKTQAAYETVAEKQAVTAAALAEQAQQRALAEKNFQQAREMLDFFVQASVEDLAGLDGAQTVRGKLLRASLAYYDEFIQQSGDNPPLQAELAASHVRVAEILDEVGSTSAAKSALEQAVETQERLVREHPEDAELRRHLFAMYYRLGVMRGSLWVSLISNEATQEHLKITDEQRAKMSQIIADQQRAYQAFCDSRSVDLPKMRKEFQEHTAATRVAIAEALEPDQMERLEQIILQRRGTSAFGDPNIAEKLGLTAAQREEIASLQTGAYDALHGGGTKSAREPFGTLEKRIKEVLTPAQQEQWQQMTGEPFHGMWGRRFGRRPFPKWQPPDLPQATDGDDNPPSP